MVHGREQSASSLDIFAWSPAVYLVHGTKWQASVDSAMVFINAYHHNAFWAFTIWIQPATQLLCSLCYSQTFVAKYWKAAPPKSSVVSTYQAAAFVAPPRIDVDRHVMPHTTGTAIQSSSQSKWGLFQLCSQPIDG